MHARSSSAVSVTEGNNLSDTLTTSFVKVFGSSGGLMKVEIISPYISVFFS